MNSTMTGENYYDFFDERIPKCISLIILIIGVIGNIFSMVIFNQNKMKKYSTYIYLGLLTLVDLLVLILGLGDMVLISYTGVMVRNSSFLVCRVHAFLTYCCTNLSSFILASVSIDRAIATNAINFAKFYCKPEMAYRVFAFNCVLTTLINFHYLMFLGYEKPELDKAFFPNKSNESVRYIYTLTCGSLNGTIYDDFINPYGELIDLHFYVIIPFIIMSICSFLIIRVLFISNKRLSNSRLQPILSNRNKAIINESPPLIQPSPPDTPATDFLITNGEVNREATKEYPRFYLDVIKSPADKKISISATTPTSARTNLNNNNTKTKFFYFKRNKTKNITYLLITINLLFVILLSPLVIILVIIKGTTQEDNNKFLLNIAYLLAYSNHAFNFIFYGLTSAPYRNSLIRYLTFRNIKKKNVIRADNRNNVINKLKLRKSDRLSNVPVSLLRLD